MKIRFTLITLIFLFLICAKTTYGQVSAIDSLKGTYQIQIQGNPRTSMALPENISQVIKEKRSPDKIVYTYLQPNVRIKILPLSEIKRKGFIPLPTQTMVKEFSKE